MKVCNTFADIDTKKHNKILRKQLKKNYMRTISDMYNLLFGNFEPYLVPPEVLRYSIGDRSKVMYAMSELQIFFTMKPKRTIVCISMHMLNTLGLDMQIIEELTKKCSGRMFCLAYNQIDQPVFPTEKSCGTFILEFKKYIIKILGELYIINEGM